MAKKKKNASLNIDVSAIKDPSIVRNLSYEQLDSLSEEMKKYILEITSKYGGHLSSNLGTIDAIISLCRNFDFLKDKIIFDVGHQCYAYKILTGRNLEHLRERGGPSGFQKRSESPYDHFEAGHSSTSISAANGLAIARDLKGEHYNVIAFIGDGSLINGLALEGLNNAVQGNHKVIIVVNDNEMSISRPVGGFAKMFRKISVSSFYYRSKHAYKKFMGSTRFGRWIYGGTAKVKDWIKRHVLHLNLFDLLGYAFIGPIDGHNIKAMDKAFKRAKTIDKSVVVYLKTVKGKGYKYAEEDQYGHWHGVTQFNVETGQIEVNKKTISWSKIYEKILLDSMEKNKNIVTIVPATGVGSELGPLFNRFPERTIDVGISEEHAMTMASGLAVSGLHPVICIYSTFLQRAYDEISHDLSRMNCNATLLIDRSGLVGKDGETHQGIYDEAFLYTIPNTVITMASSIEQSLELFNESLNKHGVFAIRFPKENIYDFHVIGSSVGFGKWVKLKQSSNFNLALVSLGPVVNTLNDIFAHNNTDLTFYNAVYQKPMDEKAIDDLTKHKRIVIYNPYATKYGFVDTLIQKLNSKRYRGTVDFCCLPNIFISQGSTKEQLEDTKTTIEDLLKIL